MKRLSKVNLESMKSVQATKDTNFRLLPEEHPWLLTTKLVVKPDMLFGQRGKHGLVLLDATLEQAEKFCIDWFAKPFLEINGAKGEVTHFIIEPFVPHEEEYYLSIESLRDGDLISFSTTGGVEVEENYHNLRSVLVTPLEISDHTLLEKLKKELDLERIVDHKKRELTAEFIDACHRLFRDLDFSLLEMNPFTFTKGDSPSALPLDLRAEVDDTADFKNVKNWGELEFPQPFGKKLLPEESFISSLDEKTGASLKLTVLNPTGRIWLMVAGGGASVIFADTVADLGAADELANYGEYSGNPNEEETAAYAKTLLELATKTVDPEGRGKVLLIGGAIANFTDVAKTFKGIIHALELYKEKLVANKFRIFVRRAGPNYEEGLRMMKSLQLGVPIEVFGPETTMTKIVPMAIDYIRAK